MVLKPDDFTEQAQEILGKSQEVVRRYRHSQWDVEHVLMAILEQPEGAAPHRYFRSSEFGSTRCVTGCTGHWR